MEKLLMTFEVVKSLRNPGGYACEGIDYERDGAGTVVEFFTDESEERAHEYAAWKNAREEQKPTSEPIQDQPATSRSMSAGGTHV